MRFAEVFLRMGVALVSWMLIYAHSLWLAALSKIGCGPDGAEMHALILGITPLTALAIVMIRATRTLPDIHQLLRWFGVPVLLLIPWCALSIWQVAGLANRAGVPICAAVERSAWESYWAPVQFVLLAALVIMLAINLRRESASARS